MFRWKQAAWVRRGVLAIVAGVFLAGSASAQDLAKQAESLKLVPADAATYGVQLRNREQWQAIFKSNAWARLNALDFVKMGWQHVEAEWNKDGSPLAPLRQWYSDAENRQLVQLLLDLCADEVFFVNGKRSAEFLALVQEVYYSWQLAPLTLLLEGKNPGNFQPKDQARVVLKALADNPEKIVVPELLIGFKLKDASAAKAQLKRLEQIGKMVTQNPPLQGRFQKAKIGGGSFAVLRLDGSLIPWEQLPLRDLEENAGDFDKLIDRLKALKLTVALGVSGKFVLLSIGEKTDLLDSLGKGKNLLELPEFQRLAKFAGKKVSNIAYVSKAWQEGQATRPEDIEEMLKSGVAKLKKLGLTAEQEAKIKKDIKKLAKDLKSLFSEPGANISISYLTERGQESFEFDWTKNIGLDGSRPLTLLHHVGETPLLVVASRSKYAPENYANLVKWIKIGHQYVEEYALPLLGPVQGFYEQIMKLLQPSLERIDKATGQMLLPALADGQTAFIIDGKLAGKSWHQAMPPADKDLPIPEIAVAVSVSDEGLLRKAFEEYRQALNTLLATATQFIPGAPELKIPLPETKQVKNGTLYFYPIPAELGLDSRLVPTAGLSKKVANLALSQEHAGRLLKSTPLKSSSPLLSDLKRPLASATHIDGAGFVRLIVPWVEYAMAQGHVDDNIRSQVLGAIAILNVFQSYTSVSYFEDGALVTHSEAVFRDIK